MSGPLHRPYPPDRYRGMTGEVSAHVRGTDADVEIEYRSGGTCEYLATGDQTGTTFGLYRWTFGPGESGPDPHYHRAITESFYVLSGEVRLFDGTGWRTGRPGDFIGERPVNATIHPAGLPINTPTIKALRRPLESTQFTSWPSASTFVTPGSPHRWEPSAPRSTTR